MIRGAWVRALAVMALAALAAAVIAAVTASQLRIGIDARYYTGEVDSMTIAEARRLLQDEILSDALLQMVGPFALGGVLAGVAALALNAHRANRRARLAVS